MTKIIENTLDNAFVKIQDKSKVLFLADLIKKKDTFPFTMEMLGRWKVKEALPVIIERLNTDTIKTSAIKALGGYKDVALNFNLYEDGGNNWSIELVGTESFDLEDEDWCCDEISRCGCWIC